MHTVAGSRWLGMILLLSVLGSGAVLAAVWIALAIGLDTGLGRLSYLLLPAIAVVLGSAAAIAAQVRATVRSVAREPFLQTVRSRGLPTTALVVRRVLRRAALPILAVLVTELVIGYVGVLVVRAIAVPPRLLAQTLANGSTLTIPDSALPILLATGLGATLGIVVIGIAVASVRFGPEPSPPSSPALPSTTFRSADFLDIRDLRFASGDDRVAARADGISLTVPRGEALAVIGDDAAEIATLCLAIAGLLPAGAAGWSGSILVDGQELGGMPERDVTRLRGRQIGYLAAPNPCGLDPRARIGPQVLRLLARQSPAAGNQMQPAEVKRSEVKRTEAKRTEVRRADVKRAEVKRAIDLFVRLGIDNPDQVLESYPHQIPAATAHRVLLAGALALNPALLVAHEPALGLDETGETGFLTVLHDLQREAGFTLIVASTRVELVGGCDRVAVLASGTVVEYASATELFTEPQHPRTRLLLAERDTRAAPAGR